MAALAARPQEICRIYDARAAALPGDIPAKVCRQISKVVERESLNAKSGAMELEARTVAVLREFGVLGYAMLDRMMITSGQHAGLHCFRVLPGSNGQLLQEKESLRYSLMAWTGIFATKGKSAL